MTVFGRKPLGSGGSARSPLVLLHALPASGLPANQDLIRRELRIRIQGMTGDVHTPEAARNPNRGERVERVLVRAFEVSATLAVLLNVFAAAVAIRRDEWSIAFGYVLIAAILAVALAIHWYAKHRQVPYRWRDEGWGLERWRETQHDEDAEYDDDDIWRDDRD